MGNLAGANTQGTGAISIGTSAGAYLQGINAIAMGNLAGANTQGTGAISIGNNAGFNIQGCNSISIGTWAGSNNQNSFSIAIGPYSAKDNQGSSCVAIGNFAGQANQKDSGIAIGKYAGSASQSQKSIAIGFNSAAWYQGSDSIAVGNSAGVNWQGSNCIAVGTNAGSTAQDSNSISIGTNAGSNSQGSNSIAVGNSAGETIQSTNCISIGNQAGQSNQNSASIAIGYQAANVNQYPNCIAIGCNAGLSNQGTQALVLGKLTGAFGSVAIGYNSGNSNQSVGSIAIGSLAGYCNQNSYALALGGFAGYNGQQSNAIAIGPYAGFSGQSTNAVAIGLYAGASNQPQNSIVINASGVTLNGSNANSCYIAPIRNVTQTNVIGYDTTNKELTYFTYTNASTFTQSGNDIYYNLGNVGLGTSAPSNKLDIVGNFNISSNSSYQTNSFAQNYSIISSTGTSVIDSNAFIVPLYISTIDSLTFYYTYRLGLLGSNINTDNRLVRVGFRLKDSSGNVVIDMPSRIYVAPVDAQSNVSTSFSVSSNSNILNYKNQILSLEMYVEQTGSSVSPSSSVTIYLSSTYFTMNYKTPVLTTYTNTGTEITNNLVINNTMTNSFTSSNLNTNDTKLVVSGNTNNTVAITSAINKQRQLLIGYNHTGNYASITSVEQGVATTPLRFTVSGIGINTSPSYQLDLSTDGARKLSSTTWLTGSDERVKDNIQDADIELCYNTVKNMKLKRFKWNEKYYPDVDDRNSVGFIAQEVATVFPKAVKKNNQKFLINKGETEEENVYEEIEEFHSLDIDQINKTLFGAVQKLIKKNEELELKVQNLINDLEVIKQKMP